MSSDKQLLQQIAETNGFTINAISSLAGGSINQVYLINTSDGEKVVKINSSEKFPGMFMAEKKGLEVLKASETFDVPGTYNCQEVDDKAYLLLEYKKEGAQKPAFLGGIWEESFAVCTKLQQKLLDLFRVITLAAFRSTMIHVKLLPIFM